MNETGDGVAASARGRADRWRQQFRLAGGGALESAGGLETANNSAAGAASDRIVQAREAMMRLVRDRFGGDRMLGDQVKSMMISASDAVAVLEQDAESAVPRDEQVAALEAVVAFDGTRPSFLLKNDRIDFDSSYNTGMWKTELAPFLDRMAAHAACVGRIDIDGVHEGTGFLVTPTLALTNRHVAQAMATFADGGINLNTTCTLDFGHEEGRSTYDPRRILDVVFAGPTTVEAPIDHGRFDLAVVRLSPSTLSGPEAQRCMSVGGVTASDLIDNRRFLAAIGYPARPQGRVPDAVWAQYQEVLQRLLEGEGGAKRFAPGQPLVGVRAGLTDWTATHDASTIKGNSGSPLLVVASLSEPLRAAGIHYGGRSLGDQVNWAHLLHYAGERVGYGNAGSFGDFCKREGIELT